MSQIKIFIERNVLVGD